MKPKYRIIEWKGKFIPQRKAWYGWSRLTHKEFKTFEDAELALVWWREDDRKFDEWMTPKVIKVYEE